MEGELSRCLGCDEIDLLDHGWHPFLHREDWDIVERMGLELAARMAARYDVRVMSRSGERLYVAVRTLLVFNGVAGEPPSLAGAIDLRHWESPRRHIDLGKH